MKPASPLCVTFTLSLFALATATAPGTILSHLDIIAPSQGYANLFEEHLRRGSHQYKMKKHRKRSSVLDNNNLPTTSSLLSKTIPGSPIVALPIDSSSLPLQPRTMSVEPDQQSIFAPDVDELLVDDLPFVRPAPSHFVRHKRTTKRAQLPVLPDRQTPSLKGLHVPNVVLAQDTAPGLLEAGREQHQQGGWSWLDDAGNDDEDENEVIITVKKVVKQASSAVKAA